MSNKTELFCEKNGKLHTWHTIITGFAFLTTSIAWGVYDPYVTKILNKILSESTWVDSLSQSIAKAIPWIGDFAASQGESTISATGGFTLVPLFIGFIMTFDNIFGVIFQPTFGKLSDRCRSKLGKCRPFVVYGAPVSALLFALIPLVALNVKGTWTLPATMITIILFVFSMSIWRAPAVALMPALTPPHLRSEGNAIINLMGGVGSAVAMVAGTLAIALCGLFTGLNSEQIKTNEQISFPYVFAIGAVVMILGMIVVRLFVKEPSSLEDVATKNQYADEKAAKKAEKAARKAEKLSKGERKSLLFMLGCLFFLFCGSNAITTFFALFAEEVLHKTTAEATFLMAVFAVCSMAAAIPAGKLGKKIGRKKTILLGLGLFATLSIVYFFKDNPALNWMIWILLVIGGVANMLITVNTLPLVLEIGGQEKIGTFTGYYYTATFSAQIAAPIVFGIFRMFSGTYSTLFVFSPIAFIISFLCITFVKHGEAIPDDLIKEAEMSDD